LRPVCARPWRGRHGPVLPLYNLAVLPHHVVQFKIAVQQAKNPPAARTEARNY
jgi:hypothetical protein